MEVNLTGCYQRLINREGGSHGTSRSVFPRYEVLVNMAQGTGDSTVVFINIGMIFKSAELYVYYYYCLDLNISYSVIKFKPLFSSCDFSL